MKLVLTILLIYNLAECTVFEENRIFSNTWILEVKQNKDAVLQYARNRGFLILREIHHGIFVLKRANIKRRSAHPHRHRSINQLSQHPDVHTFRQEIWRRIYPRSFNDLDWKAMWYMNSTTVTSMGIQETWHSGFKGASIIIAIVDDGIEVMNNDLRNNVASQFSFDFVNENSVVNPSPGDRHGTNCAGVAAAVANNGFCIVGVAYLAKIAGIKVMEYGFTMDSIEASSLTHKMHNIHIYSNSWGTQDGVGFDGPGPLTAMALQKGVQQGRNGLGSIYVWAAGNGESSDNCNCDGYANSIYTITISSVQADGYAATFSEICTAVHAVTYSGGLDSANVKRNIITTDAQNTCSRTFSGTSASTPMAAGIIALALEANDKLTWRDIQHLIARTCTTKNLHDRGWKQNGAGFQVSKLFGFGLMNSESLATMALNWTRVPEKNICKTSKKISNIKILQGNVKRQANDRIYTDACQDTLASAINYTEHIEIDISFYASRRGEVEFHLTSPLGTDSHILSRRNADRYSGTTTWIFMTLHNWGENPKGEWELSMSISDTTVSGELKSWKIKIHGTEQNPTDGWRENENTNSSKIPKAGTPIRNTPKPISLGMIIILAVSGGTAIVVVIMIPCCCYCKRKRNRMKKVMSASQNTSKKAEDSCNSTVTISTIQCNKCNLKY